MEAVRQKAPSTVILAAGLGKRMQSKLVKVLHPVAGRPMILYLVEAALKMKSQKVIVVVGHQGDQVRQALTDYPVTIVTQPQPRGTGHAVLQAQPALTGVAGPVLIVNGDVPLVTDEILRYLVQYHHDNRAALTLLTTELESPQGYGRIIRNARNQVARIIEEKDATPEQRKVCEINTGFYVVEKALLFQALNSVRPNNAQREYYLTDIVGIAMRQKKRVTALCVEHPSEVLGINSRADLAWAEHFMRRRILNRHMSQGVSVLDPDTAWVDHDVQIGRDTVLYPGVRIEGQTRIGEDCTIHSHTRISDSRIADGVLVRDCCVVTGAEIERGARVGPFAHLRPGTVLRPQAQVGNFVEIKQTVLGEGSKANHLSYLGDATIGRRVNIGAGTITCNYDGQAKHPTVIDDEVFVGSDSQFVAPVRVGKGAVIGAGTTVTEDVPAEALVLSRARQTVKMGWAGRRKARGHDVKPQKE